MGSPLDSSRPAREPRADGRQPAVDPAARPESGAGADDAIAFVTLGCPKNLVDSEQMLGDLHRSGFRLTGDPAEASLVVVNTCAFLTASQQESIDTILEMARLKEAGSLRALVVTGCLPQRHGEAVLEEIPEVDYLLGPGTLHELPEVARGLLNASLGRGSRLGGLDTLTPEWEPRVLSGQRHAAYLKISEGCNNTCTFCIIPQLRGRHRSRPIEELVAEARALAAMGVQEISIVAQDTTSYGLDLYGKFSLDRLLEALDEVDGIRWIRVLYTYPRYWTDELLGCFGRLRRLVPYVDIPIQHASEAVLRRMRRGLGWKKTEEWLRRIRGVHPEMVVRTTVITGFPGETDEDFRYLLSALRDFEFDHLGAFAYSTEEGTPAADLSDSVPDEVRAERRDAILEQQRSIALRRNRARIGRRLEVLVDSIDPERGLARGRWFGQAPEIDGDVLLPPGPAGRKTEAPRPGAFVAARIKGAGPYDLIASLEEETQP